MSILPHQPAEWPLTVLPPGQIDLVRRQIALSCAFHGVQGDLYFYRGEDERQLALRVLERVLTCCAPERNGGRAHSVQDLLDTLRMHAAEGGEWL